VRVVAQNRPNARDGDDHRGVFIPEWAAVHPAQRDAQLKINRQRKDEIAGQPVNFLTIGLSSGTSGVYLPTSEKALKNAGRADILEIYRSYTSPRHKW